MQELVQIESDRIRPAGWADSSKHGLVLSVVRGSKELERVQRLRYQVFTEEMGAIFPANCGGIDQDRYDAFCEHLMVREQGTGRVVGTYRVLTPENAIRAGGYYSESEFDLSAMDSIRSGLVECGRSCTHPDYRHGGVIMLLWNGVAEFLRRGGYRYVLGCASVSLRDDGITAAQVWRDLAPQLGDRPPLAKPLLRYPVELLDYAVPARLPPLIKGYMKLGASVCGEAAWDPDFNAADFPILLDIERMDERHRRHLGLDYTPTLPA
jgi:putative hemolysin